MDAIWVGLGIVIVAATLVDVFLTALNYDEAGFLAGRLASWQWRLARRVTRRLPRRWRPIVLRQVTGLQVLVTIAAWLAGTILGYAFIYFGQMRGDSFKYSGGSADFFSALYFSAGQLSTVGGTSLLTPNTDALAALSMLQSLTGVVLVSLTLTFLLGVYDVVSSLRSLSSQFYNSGAGVRDPITTLAPFFPDGQERGLDSQLGSLSESFAAYSDGVRLHHAAYYFQSGRDTFSLPYSLHMLAGVIEGLRWGLPRSQPAAQEPTLLPLTDQFEQFEQYLHGLIQWQSTAVPETVQASTFARQVTDLRLNLPAAPGEADTTDPWVRGFVQMNVAMADLVKRTPLVDLDEAYARYVDWLPFAYRAQQFTTAVAHDLDYQPLYSGPQNRVTVAAPAPLPTSPLQRGLQRAKELVTHRVAFIDPGYARLVDALRVTAGTVVAVGIVAIVFGIADEPLVPAAIFAGLVALLTSTAAPGRGRGRSRLTGLVALVPVLLALGLDAVVRHESFASSAALVVVAFISVLAGLYGPRLGRLGMLGFVTYYFTVLLRLDHGDLLLLAIPAVVGVVCAVLAQMVPDPGAHARVVEGGVAAFEQRVVRSVDPLIDAVSAARWDPDLQNRVRSEMNRTHHTAAFLVGQLTQDAEGVGLSAAQARAVGLHVHDAELALDSLVAVAQKATGAGIPLEARAELAGTLQSLQQHVAAGGSADAQGIAPADEVVARWPRAARRVLLAALQLQETSDGLMAARTGDLARTGGDDLVALPRLGVEPAVTSPPPTPDRLVKRASPDDATPIWRRSVQAGTATGLALLFASFVSSSHQYWAGMPAYQVVGESDGESLSKGLRKAVGTVLGAVVGFTIAIESDRNDAVLVPILALCVFAGSYFRRASTPLATFWNTMLLAQLYEYLGRLDIEAVGLRVVETIIGAVVALVVTALVVPTRARSNLAQQAAALIETASTSTRAAIEVWRRGQPVSTEQAAEFSRAVDTMTADLRTLRETAGSAGLDAGTFDPSGVRSQLSRWWELAYHVRAFVAATEQANPADARLTAEQWDQLETETAQNFDALIAAYDARPAGGVEPDLAMIDLEDDGESAATRRALRALARANQTVAIMAGETATQPGNA